MPLSISSGLQDPGFERNGESHATPRLVRIVRILSVTYWFVHVAYWFVVGGFLILFPWLDIWQDNYLLYRFPPLRSIVTSPYLKSAVLALGIINLLIGLDELVNLRKNAKIHFSR